MSLIRSSFTWLVVISVIFALLTVKHASGQQADSPTLKSLKPTLAQQTDIRISYELLRSIVVSAQTPRAATAAIKEYSIPTHDSGPFDITVGPDHNIWFTEWIGGKIGRISPTTDSVTEYSLPTAKSWPRHITSGPDGNLWFTQHAPGSPSVYGLPSGGKIGPINPVTGAIIDYPLMSPLWPEGITAGPDGNLWFTEVGLGQVRPGKIGRINPSTGDIVEYPVPHVGDRIVAGPDRSFWFTERFVPRIGRFDPLTGAVGEYPVPGTTVGADDLIVGPNGTLWLAWSDAESLKIGRINPTTKDIIAEYAIPSNQAGSLGDVLTSLTMAPDGSLWFAMLTIDHRLERPVGGKIGRVAPSGAIAMYPLPLQSYPGAVVVGPDGNLWFTELSNNKIGRITPGIN